MHRGRRLCIDSREGGGARGGQLSRVGTVGEAAAEEGAVGEARANLKRGDRAGGERVIAAVLAAGSSEQCALEPE